MKTLLRLLLKSQHQRNRSEPAKTDKGMTLVELLVGSIMAFLIITPMLGFVVNMLNTDRREQVKSNTEQDLQAAVDFIAQDLSQAIYIYDQAGINAINNSANKLPPPPTNTTGSPILVFWKRQQIKNTLPIDKLIMPKECDKVGNENKCNDTYVMSLVAYYYLKDSNNPTWCQPSGGNCPIRIARYEIKDGVRNPYATEPTDIYYKSPGEISESKARDTAFNQKFDFSFSNPTDNVTTSAGFPNPEVLVNYIDHTKPGQALPLNECTTALGSPTDPKDSTKKLDETRLKVTDTEGRNSFYACVDTARNVARVTIRGNSLRRLQPSDVASSSENSAFFPTATVQVKGLSGLGK